MQSEFDTTSSFGLQELVEALRQQVDTSTKLLSQVIGYWTTERPCQELRELEELVPIDEIESATRGLVTTNQARWQARNRDENGLAPAFVKIGRKLHINLPVYMRLVAKHQEKN